MLIAGIDEAGRGPVIGPLVLAIVAIEDKHLYLLEALNLKDSKLLSPKQRNEAYARIIKIVKAYRIITIEPSEIDDELNSDSSNLNWLEAKKTAELINGLGIDQAYLDCPSPNIENYSEYLKYLLTSPTNLICEHKADITYKIVSAASILAKVTRDKEIAELQKKIPEKIGSGYPADPVTKEFLLKYHEKYPEIFRKTWAPYKKIIESKNQSSLKKFT